MKSWCRESLTLGTVSWVLSHVVACGSNTPPPEAPDVVVAESTSARKPSSEAAPKITDRFALLTFTSANIARDWPMLSENIPAQGNVRQMLSMPVGAVASAMLGSTLGGVIDLERPVVIVSVIAQGASNSEQELAVGMMVNDVDAAAGALRQEFNVTPLYDLGFELEPGGQTPVPAMETTGRCHLRATAEGKVGWLVCGQSNEAMFVAGDELTSRTKVLLQEPEHAFELRFTRDGMHNIIGDAEKTAQSTRSEPERQGEEIAFKAMREINGMRLGLDRSSEALELTFILDFDEPKYTFSRYLLAHNRSQTLPDAFFALPSDSLLAMSSSGVTPSQASGPAQEYFDALLKALPAQDWDPAGNEELVAASKRLVMTGGPWLFASGMSVDEALSEIGKYRAASTHTSKQELALNESLSRWAIIGAQEPFEQVSEALREAIRVDQKYTLQGGKRTNLAKEAKTSVPRSVNMAATTRYGVSIIEDAPARLKGLTKPALHFRYVRVPNQNFQTPPGDALPSLNYTVHLYLAEMKGHTFLCVAVPDKQCPGLLATMAGSGERTLATLPVATQLRAQTAPFVMVTSARGSTALVLNRDTVSDLARFEAVMPKLGTIAGLPVVLTGGATGTQGAERAFALSATFDARLIEALLAFAN